MLLGSFNENPKTCFPVAWRNLTIETGTKIPSAWQFERYCKLS